MIRQVWLESGADKSRTVTVQSKIFRNQIFWGLDTIFLLARKPERRRSRPDWAEFYNKSKCGFILRKKGKLETTANDLFQNFA